MLMALDGSHTRADTINRLVAAVDAGELNLKRADQPITDSSDKLEQIGRFYDQVLPQFGKKGLLVA